MDIKFHCYEQDSFKREKQFVRAFTYTDYAIDPHNHDFYEMNVVLGGVGIHEIEGESFPVKRGDVFVIPPMTVHAYRNTEHLEIYHVLFKKDFIRRNSAESVRVAGFLKFMEIEPFLRQNYSEAMFLHLAPSQMVEIQSDFKFIEDGNAFDNDSFLPLKEHTVWKLVYYLSYLLEQQTTAAEKEGGGKYRRQILDTLEYLSSHFSDKITISELAGRVYLSRSTFLRSFVSVCGCSPIEYLNNYRIKRAVELLELGTLSKTEIAHSCGFYDLSHMEKSIKRSSIGVRKTDVDKRD